MKELLETITKNRQVQVLTLLLAAIVIMDASFYFLRTAPAVSKTAAMEAKIEDLRKQIRDAESERALYGSYESGQKQIEQFKALLPRRSEYIELLRRVYRMAKEDGMKSTSLSTDVREEKAGELTQLKFTMPVTGSYKNARKFISDIETSPMFLTINNLSLSTGPEGDISFTLALSTYMRS